jgi:hypothetical protein
MRDKEFPECRWVTVVDADGRRRLEMRWHLPVVTTQEQIVALVVTQAEAVARAA